MINFPIMSEPMGADALSAAAEDMAKHSLALTDLAQAVAAYDRATGRSAVVDFIPRRELSPLDRDLADRMKAAIRDEIYATSEGFSPMRDHMQDAMTFGMGIMESNPTGADKHVSPAEFYAGLDKASGPDRTAFAVLGPNGYEPLRDPELTDALFPQPVPEAGTIEEAQAAGAQAIADLVEEPTSVQETHSAPSAADNPPLVVIADEDEPESHMPEFLRANPSAAVLAAMRHLNSTKVRYTPKWSRFEDAEMVRRILNGEPEKAIAAVMEFSLSLIHI